MTAKYLFSKKEIELLEDCVRTGWQFAHYNKSLEETLKVWREAMKPILVVAEPEKDPDAEFDAFNTVTPE